MTDSTTGRPPENGDGALVTAKEGSLSFHAGMSLGQLAKTIAGSGCFGRDANPYVVAVKILAGHEIGLGPIEAMRGLHLFDGKIELGSAAMSSKIKGSGFFDFEVASLDETGCVLKAFEKSQRTGEWQQLPDVSFTMAEAKRANLTGKKGPWQTYPADMCFARAIARFFRRYCPHLAGGAVYAEGEVSTDLAQEPLSQPGAASAAPSTPEPPKPPGAAELVYGPEVAESDPAEHPFARFIAQSDDLKAAILAADLGVEDRYRKVFGARGLKNRGVVGKGDTKVQREILLELHDALKEALAEKAGREAKADPEVAQAVTLGPKRAPEVGVETGRGRTPDNTPPAPSQPDLLPFG